VRWLCARGGRCFRDGLVELVFAGMLIRDGGDRGIFDVAPMTDEAGSILVIMLVSLAFFIAGAWVIDRAVVIFYRKRKG
jgi:hypothetical protein